MVLKTRLNRPVQSSVGHCSSPVRPIRPEWHWIGVGQLEPMVQQVNKTKCPILSKPAGSIKINFFLKKYIIKTTSFCRVYNEHHDFWLQTGNPPALVLPPQQLSDCRYACWCVVARNTQTASIGGCYKSRTVPIGASSQFHTALEADKDPCWC